MQNNIRGFTLIELAIVIVVIGILIGATLTGQGMMHASALQSVVADFEKYRSATLRFKERYKQLPGDFSAATTVWGADTCPPAASNDTFTTTCNGDGNTRINGSLDGPFDPQSSDVEPLLFWQHLKNAEFINGMYNGRLTPVNLLTPGVNIPKSEMRDGVFMVRYFSTEIFTNNPLIDEFYYNDYNHVLFLESRQSFANDNVSPVLTPEEASVIDQKIDDGKPGQGKVLVPTPNLGSAADCATDAVAATAAYDTSADAIACPLIFITGF